ncbi:MAG: glycosyltransferase [Chitinophagaceae bacterium]
MAKKVIIIGPAHPLRGGLASFNERLATEFQNQGFDTSIYTFSLQYPQFLFPGTTQYSTEPAPKHLIIKVCINSINPFNWLSIGYQLFKLKPALIVVRYWLPFMGPCLGTILRFAKWNKTTKIVCIADNVIPHEKRIGDTLFTQYFTKVPHAFVTMSEKVMADLRKFSQKPASVVVHPLYDNFGEKLNKADARKQLGLAIDEQIILFFGFIRGYKGLDLLLKAMNQLKKLSSSPIKLLIAGEFYEDRTIYDTIIKEEHIEDLLYLRTDFIPDSEVKYYLSAADFVIQPYKNATQSGVTPLAYHFEVPMLVTNVGGLAAMVPNNKVGQVVEPNPTSIAEGIVTLYQTGVQHYLPFLQQEKQKYSWQILQQTITRLVDVTL